jgi:hypothetical protein
VAIRRWHWGKIAVLWAWGGIIVALLLTKFLSQQATVDPVASALSFFASLAILAALTVVTWIWLGGKEPPG